MTRSPSETITMLASKSNGTNASRMQGTESIGSARGTSASSFNTNCPWPSYPSVRVLSTAGNPISAKAARSDASSSTAAYRGVRSPLARALSFSRRRSCESQSGRNPCGMLYFFSSGISTLPGTFSNS